jgi:pimeloyl-ACP methyl ester carboxylesterase
MSRILAVSLFALVLAAPLARGQDYAREKRWAKEVVPNIVVGDAVWLQEKGEEGRKFLGIYTAVKGAKQAVLLVHGLGVHPNYGLIGELRVALSDMGYATLSIQMPVERAGAKAADYFPALFPEAVERIGVAAAWLAEKGFAHPVLLSHSMGSWMSETYLAETPEAPFAAWVCLGRAGPFGDLDDVHVPILDVMGANDLPLVVRWSVERGHIVQRHPGSKQVVISASDHFYTGRERALEDQIGDFLAGLE